MGGNYYANIVFLFSFLPKKKLPKKSHKEKNIVDCGWKMESSINEIVCQIDTEWKFKKVDLMDVKENENLEGKYFYAYNIPGIQYYLIIFPTVADEVTQGQTRIFFNVNGSKKRKIDAEFTISIASANYSKSYKRVFVGCIASGGKCCQTSEFFESKSKYFVNGEITIKVNGTLKIKRPSTLIISSPISIQWKIKEADLKEILKEEKNEMRLCSGSKKVPSFSDVSYKFAIYPNEIRDGNEAGTFIYLKVKNQNHEKFAIIFDVSIKTAKFNTSFQGSCNYSMAIGTFICSTKDLFDPSKGFIVNGYLTVNFNGILIKEENHHYITLKFKKEVVSKLAIKRDDEDYLIVVGENEIQVHKKVITEVSPVFAEMIESKMKEPVIENKIIIANFSFKTVEAAIKLCYGVSILLDYLLENLLSLYKFGHEYRISLIMNLIEEYLIREISPSNVVYLIKFSSSDPFNIKTLHQSCIEFFIKCSKESTPIYASESLGEQFLATMVLNSFSSHG